MKRMLSLLVTVLLSFSFAGCSYIDMIIDKAPSITDVEKMETISEDGYFTSREDVALYIQTYKGLPNNFITKKRATNLGWKSNKGNLWEISDKKSIGGDRFGNREGKLPKKEGREYFECDIDYNGGYRGQKRIVYSNDGLIYYTQDHYNTFTLLYGDE